MYGVFIKISSLVSEHQRRTYYSIITLTYLILLTSLRYYLQIPLFVKNVYSHIPI